MTTRERLHELADKIEAGVQTLAYEAENATPVLEDRGWPGTGEQAEAFAGRHADAALAAQQYADDLRFKADTYADSEIQRGAYGAEAQAERVAHATELGGFLVDGRAFAQRQRYWDDKGRELAVEFEDQKAAECLEVGGWPQTQAPFRSDQSEGVHRFDLSTGADLTDTDDHAAVSEESADAELADTTAYAAADVDADEM